MADGQGWTCPNCGNTNRPGARFCSRCRTQNPATAGGAATQRIPGTPGAPARASGTPGARPARPTPRATPGDASVPAGDMQAAGQELLSKVGNVQFEGLQQWLLLRYQQLPALQNVANQIDAMQLPEWNAERAYVLDYLARAAAQLNPSKRYSISFVGRNGLGKSTLVNAMLGGSYLPEAFREPVTAAVTRVRHLRDRPSPEDLIRTGVQDPTNATVRVEYFDEKTFLAEVLVEYYRRLNAVPGVQLPMPATLDNAALDAVRRLRGKLNQFPEAQANAETLIQMIDAWLRVRQGLPRFRWLTFDQARKQINEKEATGAEKDLLRVTREVTYYVDDSATGEPLLTQYGIELIDLPGLEADVNYHEQTTFRALNEADAVVVVLQARRPVEKNTLVALAELARRKGWSDEYREKFGSKVFVVLNRADEVDLQPVTINEYFGANREGLERIIHDMVTPVLPNYWSQHQGADASPFYLVSGYGALYAEIELRRARRDPLTISQPLLFPSLKERGDLIYQAYETIAANLPFSPRPAAGYDLNWLLNMSGMPVLKTEIGTFVRTRRFSSSLEQAGQGLEDSRTRMRNLLTRFIESRGVGPDEYDRYRQMGTDIQIAWDRIDRAARNLRSSFTEAILATQRDFPNRPDPEKGDRLVNRLDERVQAVKAKMAESLTRGDADLRQAALEGGATNAQRPANTLADLVSSTPDLVNQASILQADRVAQLVLDLRNQLDAHFGSSAPDLANIMNDAFESKLKAVGFEGKLKKLTYDQQDVWRTAGDSYRRVLGDLRTHYSDMVRTVLLRDLVDPSNSVEDERSTILKALAAMQQTTPPPKTNGGSRPAADPQRGAQPRRGGLLSIFDQQPEPEPQPQPQPQQPTAPPPPAPVFSQSYSLSLMVIETIQVELRRVRDINAATGRAKELVQQAFGMLAERMKAVAEPLKRLYWLELSRLQDTGSRGGSIEDLVDAAASEIKRRVVSDEALRQRVLSEPDPDEVLRQAVTALDALQASTSSNLRPELRRVAEDLMVGR